MYSAQSSVDNFALRFFLSKFAGLAQIGILYIQGGYLGWCGYTAAEANRGFQLVSLASSGGANEDKYTFAGQTVTAQAVRLLQGGLTVSFLHCEHSVLLFSVAAIVFLLVRIVRQGQAWRQKRRSSMAVNAGS